MKTKVYVDLAIGMIGATVAPLFGGFDYLFKALTISMGIDILLGIACAYLGYSKKTKGGKIESRAFIKGVFRKVYELALIAVAVQLDVVLGTDFCRNGACIAFFCGEIISITENGALLGVPVPECISKAIEVLNKKDNGGE